MFDMKFQFAIIRICRPFDFKATFGAHKNDNITHER